MAEDRHVGRIAPEGVDVGLHPAQRGHDVEQPLVAGRRHGALRGAVEVDKTERPQAVIDRDDDNVTAPGQRRPVVVREGARADAKPPAVDVDHDGPRAAIL